MKRDQFIFHYSYFEKIKPLNEKAFKESVMALCDYGFNFEKKEWEGPVKELMDHAVPLMGYGFREV